MGGSTRDDQEGGEQDAPERHLDAYQRPDSGRGPQRHSAVRYAPIPDIPDPLLSTSERTFIYLPVFVRNKLSAGLLGASG
jgi:hypothetical protein